MKLASARSCLLLAGSKVGNPLVVLAMMITICAHFIFVRLKASSSPFVIPSDLGSKSVSQRVHVGIIRLAMVIRLLSKVTSVM